MPSLDQIVERGKSKDIRVHNSNRFQAGMYIDVFEKVGEDYNFIARLECEEIRGDNILRIKGGIPESVKPGMIMAIGPPGMPPTRKIVWPI